MINTIDSRLIPRHDRVEAIAEQGRKDIIPVDIDYGENDPLAVGAVIDLGAIRISKFHTSAVQVGRTPTRTEDDYPPSIMLALSIRGEQVIVQDGREVVQRPGDLCVYRSDSSYWVLDDQGYRNTQILVNFEKLALPPGLMRDITAVRLCEGLPIADLAAAYFYRLTSELQALDTPSAQNVSQPTIEMLRAVISTHVDAGAMDAGESAHTSLQLRILEYTRAHLGDPKLSAHQIASAHHISVRHLYNILAEGEISLGDWIRSRRLEASRDQLRRPSAREMTIASVAHQWGFVDVSSFGRAFRAAYGVTPRELRDARHPGDATAHG